MQLAKQICIERVSAEVSEYRAVETELHTIVECLGFKEATDSREFLETVSDQVLKTLARKLAKERVEKFALTA